MFHFVNFVEKYRFSINFSKSGNTQRSGEVCSLIIIYLIVTDECMMYTGYDNLIILESTLAIMDFSAFVHRSMLFQCSVSWKFERRGRTAI